MSDLLAELRCIVARTDFKQYANASEHTVHYKKCDITIDAPEEGSSDEQVSCPVCGKTFTVNVVSSRTNTIKHAAACIVGLLISSFMGQGFYFRNFKIEENSVQAFKVIGFIALFIIPACLILYLIKLCVKGTGPSAQGLRTKACRDYAPVSGTVPVFS